MEIKFEQLKAETATFTLAIDHWIIQEKQSWGVFSTEGDIGSLLGDLLCGESFIYLGILSPAVGILLWSL
ncbi:hypothetical protein [Psychromonas antarctica]|uniref:hypothetical protein n=1 Tax=Psychromonas antarctica TaxID=67573 RepID=UPI001EE7E7DE|nr:hypothetical protein [Psychromonas antarctica]